jgi:Rrf2 family protein
VIVTREIDYALRAVLYLSKHTADGRAVVTSDLSKAMEIPYRFLRKIINSLCKAGITESHRGKCGGVTLARQQSEISLLDVVNAIDSDAFKVNICVDGESCTRSTGCSLCSEMQDLQELIVERLDIRKFSDFVTSESAKKKDGVTNQETECNDR